MYLFFLCGQVDKICVRKVLKHFSLVDGIVGNVRSHGEVMSVALWVRTTWLRMRNKQYSTRGPRVSWCLLKHTERANKSDILMNRGQYLIRPL